MKRRGFTLVELLVVMAVGAILVAIAIPSYAFLVNGNRLAAATNELITALQLTRSEAVKRGQRVTLCKTGNAMTPAPFCDANAHWQDGWLVFVDGGTRGVIDPQDTLLWTGGHAHPSIAISTGVNYDRFVSYQADGTSRGLLNANGTFEICLAGARRDLIINMTGRVRLQTGSC